MKSMNNKNANLFIKRYVLMPLFCRLLRNNKIIFFSDDGFFFFKLIALINRNTTNSQYIFIS